MSNTTKIALCLLFACLQGALFIGAERSLHEQLSFPLDDSFIHLQYGKQIARGYYFQYQDADPVSGGATSFLYPHLLAIGWLLGFQQNGLVLWALLIAFASITAIFYFLIRCGEHLGSVRAGWAALALVLLSGHLGWAFWSGMEIALFTALFLWMMSEVFHPSPNRARLGVAMGLLALTRPEGVLIAVTCVGLMLARRIWRRDIKSLFSHPSQTVFATFFIGASIFGPPLFYRMAMGRWGGNSLMAKSLLYHPIKSAAQRLGECAVNAIEIVKFYMGAPSVIPRMGEFMFPGALALAVVGVIAYAFSQTPAKRWFGVLAGLPLLIVFAAVATLEVWQLHNFRYLAPMIPWLFLWSVIGLEAIYASMRIPSAPPVIATVVLIALLVSPYLPAWASRYAHESTVIAEKQRQAAEWAATNLNGASLAINDAGALAFYGALPVFDLVGLISNETTLAYRIGEGALYERMQRLPQKKRPQFAVVFPSWFEEMSRRFDLFYRPRVRFPDPFDPAFGKTVYEINWLYSGHETAPRDATLEDDWHVVDSIDIADVMDEEQHGYALELRDGRFPKVANPFRRNFGYHEEIDQKWPGVENEVVNLIPKLWADGSIYDYDIVDAGRRINGAESFTFSGLAPNQEAKLILRTCDNEGETDSFDFRMAVEVNGVYLGEWTVEGTPWNWYEIVFTVPAEAIQTDSLRVRVRNIGTSRFPYFDSYMYWICQ
ncbi:MAG: hypothetical protein P9L94_19705 [Candidatus Hinthialibacter antarcticus]|nr:hypothetical protein [Candidatus Hinthialibacter antarcticus]